LPDSARSAWCSSKLVATAPEEHGAYAPG
jgi:hypothetical protein